MSFQNKGSIFTSVPKKKQKSSAFNLSHDVKLSLDMGSLYPTLVQEVLPGDSFKISTTSMMRLAPLISPVMHKINVYQEFFFVPNRILWQNWESFITGARNGKQLGADELPAFPTILPWADGVDPVNGIGSLMDYMGLPVRSQFQDSSTGADGPSQLEQVNALPFAAYQRIWEEYYRDENLMQSLYEVEEFENYDKLRDASQTLPVQRQLMNIRPRAWEHDYFTSALPWAQKGEEVTIPMDLAPNYNPDGSLPQSRIIPTRSGDTFLDPTNETSYDFVKMDTTSANTRLRALGAPMQDAMNRGVMVDNAEALRNTTTINDLRAAIKLQEWLETNARGGSRYFESIYAHFGVKSPDARLQRPEFIGSHRTNMVISEVLQTSSAQGDLDTPQGNMSGHGQSVGQSKNFKYYAQEHGYIIGILSVLPNTAYQQGIPKHFLKYQDRLQYYFPQFAHLGEQEILNKELWAGTYAGYDPDGTFGYTPRYAEYKFMNSRVAGDFRETLDYWHLGRIFDTPPSLSDGFIAAEPSKRIFAVENLPDDQGGAIRDYNSIYAHVFFDIKARRLMPKYGTPML